MAEFLLELVSEDIPPAMQDKPAQDCACALEQVFIEAGSQDVCLKETFSTPLRFGVYFDNINKKSVAMSQTKRGPRQTAPQKAIQGFKKSLPPDAVIKIENDYYFATLSYPQRAMADILKARLPLILRQMDWAKSMRWIEGDDFRWPRPLRHILCIFDGKAVDFEIANLKACAFGQDGKKIQSFLDYRQFIKNNHILIDPHQRASNITKQIEHLTRTQKGAVISDYSAERLSRLTETPFLQKARMEREDIKLPSKIIDVIFHKEYCLPIQIRQKNTLTWQKELIILFKEKKPPAIQKLIIQGFITNLKARLKDAAFFIEQDKIKGIERLRDELKSISFHSQLGSLYDKAERIRSLAMSKLLTQNMDENDKKMVAMAAYHAKSDIASLSGREMPEALGDIGKELFASVYLDGTHLDMEPKRKSLIADAIQSHALPQKQKDGLPSQIGQIVALADKADSLAGFFSIGELPSGSKDPFALRRLALGLIRIIFESSDHAPLFQNLDVMDLFRQALTLYQTKEREKEGKKERKAVLDNLYHFVIDRLKYLLRAQGKNYDLVDAAIHNKDDKSQTLKLKQIQKRVEALEVFLKTPQADSLMVAWRRVHGILKQSPYKDHDNQINEKIFEEKAEKNLNEALKNQAYHHALKQHDFTQALTLLADLRPAIDDFFDHVRLDCDNPTISQNRYALIGKLRDIMWQAADFSAMTK